MPNNNTTYLVKANEFEFTFTDAQIAAADVIKKSAVSYNLIAGNRSVNTLITDDEHSEKKLIVEVEGESFQIEIKEELDQMMEKMGFGLSANKHIREIKAPMPGLVLQIAVEEGQEVAEGDKILILEAMKMENSILIHAAAKIKKIVVKPGQAVEKGQILVELE